jgi:hypothetical protein
MTQSLEQEILRAVHHDLPRGLAVNGPLRGQGLQPIPSLTAFDWAWFDFYPDSDL